MAFEDITENNTITLKFTPRPQQAEILSNLKRFNVLICHRRFGKTTLTVNYLIRKMLEAPHNKWTGAYITPSYAQGAKVALKEFYDVLEPLIEIGLVSINKKNAVIECENGARVFLLGTQNYDSLRGLGLDLVVIDEVAQIHPAAWSTVIYPTLSDRQGQAIFIGTPQGKNLLSNIWENAEENELWYRRMFKASETGLLPNSELEIAKSQMSDEEYEQEYECSFDAPVFGSYYGKWLTEAEAEGRIGEVPYEPNKLVYTAWDLGVDDSTAIWFFQVMNNGSYHFIDYYEDSNEGLVYYFKFLKDKPYLYGTHIAPHDIMVRELMSGKSRYQQAQELGFKFVVAKKTSLDEGIQAVRNVLPKCYFDKEKCEWGLDALRAYRKEINSKMSIADEGRFKFKDRPVHDWSSHGSDAFRTFAMGFRNPNTINKRPKKAKTGYKIFG